MVLKKLNFIKKKQLRYREINREDRIKYHHKILNLSKRLEIKALYGSFN